MAERCNVSSNTIACEISTSTKCFACGNAACAGCTTVVHQYYKWHDKRICNDCIEDHRESIVVAKDSGPLWGGLPTLQRTGVVRWWIRNKTTQQVLGSVQAASEEEALGKAMVRWHVDTWQRYGLTATKGGA